MNVALAAGFVIPVSIVKWIIMVIVLLVWARWATFLDKEAEYYFLGRRRLNMLQIGALVLAYLLWFMIPIYWIGLPLALGILIAAGVIFGGIRNNKVSEDERWELSLDFINQALLQRRQAAATRQAVMRFVIGAKTSHDFKAVPLPSDPKYKAHVNLEELVEDAIQHHAQEIDIAIPGQEASVKVKIDGVSYPRDNMPAAQAVAMVDYLKEESGMDVEERRKKQTGQVRVDLGEHGQHVLRVHTAGSTRGLTCDIEVDPGAQLNIPLDKLGLLDSQLSRLKPLIEKPEGVVLVACPPGNGRTTTLYSLVQEHDPYMIDIHSVERSVEMEIEGVNAHIPGEQGMAKTLQSLLLRDPKVVLVSQIADKQCPPLIARAGVDQKRLYVGIRADDTFQALRGWLKAAGDAGVAADGLSAVIAQRLLRRLCPVCRQSFQPEPAALKKLNLPADRIQQLYKASGKIYEGNREQVCPSCNGLGFLGRTAAFEILVIDTTSRQLIKQGNFEQVRSHQRKNKMLMLQEAALAKVVAGETSITEVMRVLGNQ